MAEQQHGRFSIVPSRAVTSKLPETALLVLLVLGMYSDREGWSWPSQTTMAELLGMSRQTINRNLDILVTRGFILREARTRANGSNTSCRYRILFDVFDEEPVVEKEPELEGIWQVARALAEVCKLEFDLNQGRLLATAKSLRRVEGFSIAKLKQSYEVEWYRLDFRGKKGSPPTLYQVTETWKQYTENISIQVDVEIKDGYFNG